MTKASPDTLSTNTSSLKNNYWAVIPAAGVGKRMGSKIPKQYLPLAGKTVLEQTLNVFIQHSDITGIVVAVTEGDPYWQEISVNFNQENMKPVIIAPGGQERCHSVLNALQVLSLHASDNDWALVHDAARPCLTSKDLDQLISRLSAGSTGGLLGVPMADTVKSCDKQQNVIMTVDRSELWRALTPQMFPYKLLQEALAHAIENKALVTDEASAIELQGLQPKMVEGHPGNIKITHPGDLQLAELFFANASE
ncbi:MAG: 2-C-methyl-D-erythritol 4-phosphate cytidylyltransferase [gamma proteobacterium symbiont of Bathyaustriella thionipta]|nr:2-C-methyl-D-erythritol 4-phosphate cytidylyltransferase [gamma proteobacterium symbiont of Bathyaustriella thionipta]MCU7949607.1 2-C-methyl-D-erythritol 4-phosphate cytidylyltransferase [gamma proteobacterium symbiont of Bathyaustriella thionipta]MCU7953317.1 2-C-methyl-D-erythritol 4-phosphate cytidylyltransferase [gamma proteobacterium symbiont of Bathyaustriella thionipta]MCU7956199.1 2-C-methyl-D-erythritol 4-phosphate cytidylyltransferase [gamma proteobacterium symbiont of Bathyaustrie